MVRISISSNGKYVKTKARGKRRKVWKIPFSDEFMRAQNTPKQIRMN